MSIDKAPPIAPPDLSVTDFLRTAAAIEAEVGRVIVGQTGLLRGVLIALIAGGNVLVEGVPGLGKTLLIRTLADTLDLRFSRIQFTPDLMPADILGTQVLTEGERGERRFSFQPGPIFANLILADEINRATPKTQSALLEAMQEQTVTVGAFGATMDEGPGTGGWGPQTAADGMPPPHPPLSPGEREVVSGPPLSPLRAGEGPGVRSVLGPSSASRPLPDPFFVLATQNPIELEGTYPLPEAQLDRFFFKLRALSPSIGELEAILDRTTSGDPATVRRVANGPTLLQMQRLAREVPVAAAIRNYVARLVVATHPDAPEAPDVIRRYVRFGASPRAAQALVIAGKISALLAERFNVAYDDIRRAAPAALRHRLILNVEAQVMGLDPDVVIEELLRAVPEQPR